MAIAFASTKVTFAKQPDELNGRHLTSYSNSGEDTRRASIKITKMDYSDALKKVAKTYNLGLAVDSHLIPDGKVTIDLKNVTIQEALDAIMKNTNVQALISPDGENIILRKKGESSNEKYSISGKVISDDFKDPLPGVTVAITGATTGTVTDSEGKFSLENIPSGGTVVFSFIGMDSREIQINKDEKDLTISLTSTNVSLNEVVAIGYGSIKRKDLTSSIATIKAEDFNSGVYSNPMQMLQGKVSGLNITIDGDPTSTPSIILRGASTLREGDAQEPLYVIDGVPSASMDLVASSDIVSVDILKDASATAIYGSQAANGVIIITTKKGSSGQMRVEYDGSFSIENISNELEMMSAPELRGYLSENGYMLDSGDDDGSDTNWQDEVTQTGISYNHNIKLSGGDDNTTYMAGVNYLSNQGIIKTSALSRMAIRANLNQAFWNKKINLGFSTSGSVTDKDKIPDDELLNMVRYLPTIGIYDEDGEYNEDPERGYNPVALLYQNTDDERIKTFQGIIYGKIQLLQDLKWEARLSYQNEQDNENVFWDKESMIEDNDNGYAKRTSFETEQKTLETFGTYSHTFNDHKLSFLAGYSWQENTSGNGFQATNSDFISDETSYYNLSLGSSYDIDYGDTTYETLRRIAFYSRLNYSFNNKYLLQATLRNDGSSAFGENDRWGLFPSISGAWRIIEESFMKNQNLFNDLRLRVGYGVSGNSLGFDAFASKLTYGTSGMYYSNGEYVTSIFPTRIANPDLKWERTGVFNVGLDFSLLKNRLGASIEYYNKLTKDLIWDYSVSYTEYYTDTYTANVGQLENKGIELSLNATPVKNGNFTWDTSATASFNKNKILSLSNDEFQLDYVYTSANNGSGQTGTYNQIIQEGYPVGEFNLWKWAGRNEQGISQFYTHDGGVTTSPSSDDRFHVGNAQPKAIFSWNNTLTYKNIGLNFFFRGVTGNKILDNTRAGLNYPAECTHYNMLKMTLNEPIEDTKAHLTSDRYLEKGDYIRLDNITLSYTLNNENKFAIPISKFRFYASVNNAFVLTKYKGLDPEIDLGGLTPGVDASDFYPKTRSFILGVNVSFK